MAGVKEGDVVCISDAAGAVGCIGVVGPGVERILLRPSLRRLVRQRDP
jgi:hypothetical protein